MDQDSEKNGGEGELWGALGSVLANLTFVYAIFKEHFPYCLWGHVERCSHTLAPHVHPYIEITLDEFSGERLKHSEVFSAIQNYLSVKASKHAARFKADVVEDSQSLVLSNVFTTNHVDKLDPALIRRGRMDKHIEMPYCCFEAFKVLAKTYLEIESHELFHEIGSLLGETNITPADVAENLMPKSDEDDAETCLKNLIEALKAAKEKAKKNAGKKQG